MNYQHEDDTMLHTSSYSLLQLADARAERWFRIAMVGWAVAICVGFALGWMVANWP